MIRYILIGILFVIVVRMLLRKKQPPPLLEEIKPLPDRAKPEVTLPRSEDRESDETSQM